MPYLDRLNRVCGFLDIEEKENSGRFQRRYFILDTQENALLWYMDNPQNLARGATVVGSLKLTYISKVNEATAKQKPKTEFCFVINAVSRRYFLQANDEMDMRDWVAALNKASKITVPKPGSAPTRPDVTALITDPQQKNAGRKQQAYKTEIIGGVVVHTPILVLTVRKSWKRRFFILDNNAVSYYKSDTDKEPLRSVPLRDIQKVHECLVKSGDLLLRDNLFEIITSSRTFYIQTDSPEEMHEWISDIDMKIQNFRGPSKRSRGHKGLSGSCSLAEERRPVLQKSRSVAPGWQPWTPVPPGNRLFWTERRTTAPSAHCLFYLLSPSGDVASERRRHRSQPQPHSRCSFPFSLDDDSIRTTDV
uniref:Si:ch211-204d2.4 n=1 Tax=Neogobius melanostomus TaxID=47308 RepID=A0A8C6WJ65_9GOBI